MSNVHLENIYLHLTKACNLNCAYCYFDGGAEMAMQLSISEIQSLVEEIAALSPIKLVFTGGEPLIREDILAIAHLFQGVRAAGATQLCLMSNGTLIDGQNALSIAQYFDEVRISMDGFQEVNDALRGKGVFQTAARAIRYLRRAGLTPGISITVTSRNIDGLDTFLDYLIEHLFVTEFHFSPFRPVGRGVVQPELLCSWKEAQEKIGRFWSRRFGSPTRFDTPKETNLLTCGHCGVGSHINIWPDGSVFPCHVLSTPEFILGNLKQTKLSVILNESVVLKSLEQLDFRNLNINDEAIKVLLSSSICLGEVYREAPQAIRRFMG
jgi:MoaA/NifB/PqqE/SkfB family radical SAM enzyme